MLQKRGSGECSLVLQNLQILLSPVPSKNKHRAGSLVQSAPFRPPGVFVKCLPAR